MKKNDPKPLRTNLIRQNCFIKDCCERCDLQSHEEEQFYESINEIVSDEGLKHERVVVPYQITSDYVNSFADSSDYRRDPVSSIVNAPKRQGLGDVRDFQRISEMDDTQARNLYIQLQERFQSTPSEPAPSELAPSEPAPSESASVK